MFEKNDKALLTARIIIIATIVISAIISLIVGILLAVYVNGLYFLYAFIGWFFCWLLWVFAKLYLSFLCDVKLIRNKLYGIDNKGLEVFIKSDVENINQDKKGIVNQSLENLQMLLDSDVITKEEYENLKNELSK